MLPRVALALGVSSLTAAGCVPDDWTYRSRGDAAVTDTPDASDRDASERDAAAPEVDATEGPSTAICEGPCDVPCARGIVSLYRGEGDARDAAGDQHALANRVTYAPGRYGRAFYVDGPPGYVSIPSAVGELEGEFTVSLWIKTDRAGRFFARRASCWLNVGYRGFDMGVRPDGHFDVEVFSYGGLMSFTVRSPVSAYDDRWHHAALVRRGATMSFYVDGQSDGPRRFDADFIDPYSTPLYLGVSRCVAGAPGNNGTSDDRQWLHGAVDEVAFYRRALTDAELGDIAAGRCAP
ncbi:MAG: LamG domain-containing protein [Polyangiales bacterium]